MYASGYPVALLASADDRDSLALISIAVYCSDVGSRANWMLHSPTIPQWLVARIAAERSMWYSWLLSVCDGAITMLSPVCTLIESTFSMLHTITLLPL